MAKLNLITPWGEYYAELNALFGDDPEVSVELADAGYEVRLRVENPEKAEAIRQLLPTEKRFGNIVLKITVIPANAEYSDPANLFQTAFAGNPAFSYARSSKDIPGVPDFNYIVFANKVVQYYNDDLSDVNGLRSTLYQDIAREVFGDIAGISYCTDVADARLARPMSSWPEKPER